MYTKKVTKGMRMSLYSETSVRSIKYEQKKKYCNFF